MVPRYRVPTTGTGNWKIPYLVRIIILSLFFTMKGTGRTKATESLKDLILKMSFLQFF